jgi:hypothetical protein
MFVALKFLGGVVGRYLSIGSEVTEDGADGIYS